MLGALLQAPVFSGSADASTNVQSGFLTQHTMIKRQSLEGNSEALKPEGSGYSALLHMKQEK